MKNMPTLPIGNSSFETIRQDNHLYVDKTRHIFKLVDEGKFYFMSRPRRFGKSLTVSTLQCLFQGRKELFKGLWIEKNTDWEWKEHPVVILDFNEIPHQTPDIFRRALSLSLEQTAQHYGVSIHTEFVETQFQELILTLSKQFNMPVAVLVDEYDKPIISHLGRGKEALEIAKQNRDVMKYFFGVLKGANVISRLRFVFLTGVSKFSRVSIFSELNNLMDITMDTKYADLLGYTHEELNTYFSHYIEYMAGELGLSEKDMLKELAVYYDGYRFSGKDIRVYNPFSVLCAFRQNELRNYWFETGTPTFLVNLLREAHWNLPKIEEMRTVETVFSTYELDDLKPEALLFQTGYVTIKAVKNRIYTFGYPNREVKTAFLESLLHSYTKGASDRSRFVLLAEYLHLDDLDSFIDTAKAIFASIPYKLETKRDEAYFHTLFYLMVSASCIDANSEVLTSEGRIDLVMAFPDKIYVIEFKCNQSASRAIKQIHDKNYIQRYRQSGKKVILMGLILIRKSGIFRTGNMSWIRFPTVLTAFFD